MAIYGGHLVLSAMYVEFQTLLQSLIDEDDKNMCEIKEMDDTFEKEKHEDMFVG